jgi:hypothetical protein
MGVPTAMEQCSHCINYADARGGRSVNLSRYCRTLDKLLPSMFGVLAREAMNGGVDVIGDEG